MELSPELTQSFQLYICLQICSKDESFPVPVAFSSCQFCVCVCVCTFVCVYVCAGARARVYVCVN